MKKLITITVTYSFLLVILSSMVLFMGCASAPRDVKVLVKYPMEGKIVWMSDDGSVKRSPYFVIEHEDFLKFLEYEREVERKSVWR